MKRHVESVLPDIKGGEFIKFTTLKGQPLLDALESSQFHHSEVIKPPKNVRELAREIREKIHNIEGKPPEPSTNDPSPKRPGNN